jgi:hypothetical protein
LAYTAHRDLQYSFIGNGVYEKIADSGALYQHSPNISLGMIVSELMLLSVATAVIAVVLTLALLNQQMLPDNKYALYNKGALNTKRPYSLDKAVAIDSKNRMHTVHWQEERHLK